VGSTKRSKRAIHRGKKESKKIIIKKSDRDNGDNETFWGRFKSSAQNGKKREYYNSHLEFFIIFWGYTGAHKNSVWLGII
jgi:hypothetical protein